MVQTQLGERRYLDFLMQILCRFHPRELNEDKYRMQDTGEQIQL